MKYSRATISGDPDGKFVAYRAFKVDSYVIATAAALKTHAIMKLRDLDIPRSYEVNICDIHRRILVISLFRALHAKVLVGIEPSKPTTLRLKDLCVIRSSSH